MNRSKQHIKRNISIFNLALCLHPPAETESLSCCRCIIDYRLLGFHLWLNYQLYKCYLFYICDLSLEVQGCTFTSLILLLCTSANNHPNTYSCTQLVHLSLCWQTPAIVSKQIIYLTFSFLFFNEQRRLTHTHCIDLHIFFTMNKVIFFFQKCEN